MSTLSDYRKVSNIESLKWELLEEESAGQEGNTWWYNLSYDEAKDQIIKAETDLINMLGKSTKTLSFPGSNSNENHYKILELTRNH